MDPKFFALVLIGLGIACLVGAYLMDRTASFENGTFIGEILLVALGVVIIAIGVIWLIVLAFLHI